MNKINSINITAQGILGEGAQVMLYDSRVDAAFSGSDFDELSVVDQFMAMSLKVLRSA